MAKIVVKADCGNSPKKLFIKQLFIAFGEGDIAFVTDSVSDDMSWNLIGNKLIQGKQFFTDKLTETKSKLIDELTVHSIITHGKEGAANGEITMTNGQKYSFCNMYEFISAKGTGLKSIISYVIEIKK